MAAINGLPPAIIPSTGRASKIKKKNKVSPSKKKGPATESSKVAQAVSNSIRHVDESQLHRAQVQYDLPEGRNRDAMEAYMQVMNQSKRDQLSQLAGVDFYI